MIDFSEHQSALARAVLTSATDFAIVTTNLAGEVTNWNPGAEALLGWSEEEMKGHHACRFFTPEDNAAGRCELEMTVARDEGRCEDERWHMKKDGSRLWASGLMMRFENERTGEHIGYLKILRDRTPQHQANEVMRESERQYRNLAEALPGFVFTTDAAGRNIYSNDFYQDYTGRDLSELAGDGWTESVHPDDRTDAGHDWQAAVDSGENYSSTMRFQRHDGAYRTFSCRAIPQHDDAGAIVRWIGTCIDVEEQRQANEALAEAEEERSRYRDDLDLALDAGNLGTFTITLPDRTLASSGRFKANFGRDPDQPFTYAEKMAAVHPEDRADMERAVDRSIENGQGYDLAFRIRWPDDSEHWIHIRARIVHDGGAEAIGMTGVGADVTAEKMQEAALNKLNIDLEHAVDRRTAELLTKNTELLAQIAVREQAEDALRQAQKMEAVGQLTGGVAHDFNNLLTIIKSSVELLSRPNLREDRRQRYMDAISQTTDRAASLTGQLLAFARRQPLKAEHFDVADQLLASLPILRTTTGSRIEVVSTGIAAGHEVEVDPNQFDTAILNMVVNARDAMPDGGRIEIITGTADKVPAVRAHAEMPGDYVTVTIADDGTGMDEETVRRIFEPFFTTKEVGRGTGLGLSQVFGFAKQSGGEVVVESVEGQGTRFTLYLARAQAPAVVIPPLETVAAPASGGGHGCVLVVEDNQLVGEFATQLLEDVGYGTSWAPHAQAALDLINENPDRFNVVFSDVVMPGISGIEMAQELRRTHPNLPVVLTSGYSQVLAQEGTHGFPLLQKPYSASNVAEVLNRVKRG